MKANSLWDSHIPMLYFRQRLFCPFSNLFKNICHYSWSDGSVVKNTYCSSRGPRFSSQYLYVSLSVASVLEDSLPSFWLLQEPGTHMMHRHTFREIDTHIFFRIVFLFMAVFMLLGVWGRRMCSKGNSCGSQQCLQCSVFDLVRRYMGVCFVLIHHTLYTCFAYFTVWHFTRMVTNYFRKNSTREGIDTF